MNRATHLRVVRPGRDDHHEGGPFRTAEDWQYTAPPLPKRLAIHSQGETEYLDAGSVIRMEASGCYTLCYLSDGRKLTVSRTLGEFERVLGALPFARVHHSHLVNLTRIRTYLKKDGYAVRMDDGVVVPVAVRRKDDFEMRMHALVL